ncbi:hypothetical protein L211DRAFT_52695 [Terfezia boudieri ATCC MYA-4762]|uniref:ARS-binding protein 1 N-terminal domain-containing protein n=1 Tax=Terfezia boudieri ATCC MYA-4762 TaxID=1051890 RepID=A0A3N4M470_9PEZI|nr:hypothetical protein L211DRAFT_52695 [Terfezia boudieri ATCC MYA-4762]
MKILQSAEICTLISTSTMDTFLLEQPRVDLKSLRRREVDPTDSERFQLFSYSQGHSKATQRELAQWFNVKFKKEINQSTVSRMLDAAEVVEVVGVADWERVDVAEVVEVVEGQQGSIGSLIIDLLASLPKFTLLCPCPRDAK